MKNWIKALCAAGLLAGSFPMTLSTPAYAAPALAVVDGGCGDFDYSGERDRLLQRIQTLRSGDGNRLTDDLANGCPEPYKTRMKNAIKKWQDAMALLAQAEALLNLCPFTGYYEQAEALINQAYALAAQAIAEWTRAYAGCLFNRRQQRQQQSSLSPEDLDGLALAELEEFVSAWEAEESAI